MDIDDEDIKLSKDEKRMKQFLEGNLDIGPSMKMMRSGQHISFALQTTARKKLKKWWQSEEIHYSQRRILVHLIVHQNEVSNEYQLVRDLSLRRLPLTRVQIKMTPAAVIKTEDNAMNRSSKKCEPIPGGPTFYLQNILGKKSDMNLLAFIRDTVTFKDEEDRIKAERAKNVKPFITPRGEDPTTLQRCFLPTVIAPSVWFQQQQQQEEDQTPYDTHKYQRLMQEAQKAASMVTAIPCPVRKDVFNDDLSRDTSKTAMASHYNPTVLLSHFSLSPSQQSRSELETSKQQHSQNASIMVTV